MQDLLSITSSVAAVDTIIPNKLQEYLLQHQDIIQINTSFTLIIQLLLYSNRDFSTSAHRGGFILCYHRKYTFNKDTSENISYHVLYCIDWRISLVRRPDICVEIPGTCQYIRPGDIVKLGRFETTRWQVGFGWFSFDENRPFYGMYLTNIQSGQVKPLLKTDLDDIYMIE